MARPASLPELSHEAQDHVVVIGAGGFTAKNLYLRNLDNMGFAPGQIVLVDTDEERLNAVHESHTDSPAYLDTDEALEALAEEGKTVSSVIIASSTAAHASNIRSVVKAAQAGYLDLSKTKVWCEKPVTPTEIFDEIRQLAADQPDLDISVGYILRYSRTLAELQGYIEEHGLTITGLDWVYGKDRTKDTRPTQGVFPDEIVHPLSVTDLLLNRAVGNVLGVEVDAATIQRRPFADAEVQDKARITNPDIPEKPTSDVDTQLRYLFEKDGTVSEIPVTVSTSFLLQEEMRRVVVSVSGSDGDDKLVVDFDKRKESEDGTVTRTDTLTKQDGTVLYEWSGDKSAAQLTQFLGLLPPKDHFPDMATSLEGEDRIQTILKAIGSTAVNQNNG